MTEADEKLSRLFRAGAPERDAAFAAAVDARLRRAIAARLIFRLAAGLVLMAFAATVWIAWRLAKPALADVFGPVPVFQMNVMGAPAPALALLAFAGLWIVFRRTWRRLA